MTTELRPKLYPLLFLFFRKYLWHQLSWNFPHSQIFSKIFLTNFPCLHLVPLPSLTHSDIWQYKPVSTFYPHFNLSGRLSYTKLFVVFCCFLTVFQPLSPLKDSTFSLPCINFFNVLFKTPFSHCFIRTKHSCVT